MNNRDMLYRWKRVLWYGPIIPAIVGIIATYEVYNYEGIIKKEKELKDSISDVTQNTTPIQETQNNLSRKCKEGTKDSFLNAKRIKYNKMENKQNGDININGNSGNTQIAINSPGSKQIINNKKAIKTPFDWKWGMTKDGLHILIATMYQTDGIWSVGEYFGLYLKFSAPYKSYKWLAGYDNMGVSNLKLSEAYEEGVFMWQTSTPPKPKPIILEIVSETKLDVMTINIAPQQLYNSP